MPSLDCASLIAGLTGLTVGSGIGAGGAGGAGGTGAGGKGAGG